MASRRLYLALQLAGHRVRAVADRQAKEQLGVTAAQLGMMFVIRRLPGCTQRDVAQQLQLRESGVTAAVAKLAGLGLVQRERRDGRTMALSLTEAGESCVADARPLVLELEERLREGFTEEELDVVSRFLDATIDRFAEGT